MKIGVDLRSLQIGHQYRGIGEIVRRTLDKVLEYGKKEHEFVFFTYDRAIDPLQFIDLPEGLNYELRTVGVIPTDKELSMLQKTLRRCRLMWGNPIPKSRDCDVFLQFDYALGIPSGVRTVLTKHDIIPLLFWRDYFTSPITHFKNKAARTTLRTIVYNYEYKRVLKRSLRRAKRIITISEHTKKDLQKYLHVPAKKMKTIYLGVSEKPLEDNARIADHLKMPTKPYLLFIGAADSRRRLEDLIDAYNNLKAQGRDIQLVLVGENFKSLKEIKSPPAKRAVKASSYIDDIVLMGYVDDATKNKLYEDAIAFVFPSHYEGFGLPVLESMIHDCPIIAYQNSSIPEVGGDHVLYAKDWQDIWVRTNELLDKSKKDRTSLVESAHRHAKKFTWEKTAKALYKELTNR